MITAVTTRTIVSTPTVSCVMIQLNLKRRGVCDLFRTANLTEQPQQMGEISHNQNVEEQMQQKVPLAFGGQWEWGFECDLLTSWSGLRQAECRSDGEQSQQIERLNKVWESELSPREAMHQICIKL
eukprot:6474452-Amphidinium_carterae.1